MDSRRSKLVLAAVIVAFVSGLVLTVTRGERSRDLVLSIEPLDPSDDVTVYVGGSVEEPGLYSLPRGSRLSEALDLAGTLESSDISSLDLAAVLDDEQTIVVPETSAAASGESDTRDAASETGGLRISINQAGADELQLLPGIGPALAERIIERRETEGPFQSLDQLTEIAGISERMVDELRESATIEP